MAKQKPNKPKGNSLSLYLKRLVGEDRMHDDHGTVIIGGRDKKPKIPEEIKDK